jgi:hypothetical protein
LCICFSLPEKEHGDTKKGFRELQDGISRRLIPEYDNDDHLQTWAPPRFDWREGGKKVFNGGENHEYSVKNVCLSLLS